MNSWPRHKKKREAHNERLKGLKATTALSGKTTREQLNTRVGHKVEDEHVPDESPCQSINRFNADDEVFIGAPTPENKHVNPMRGESSTKSNRNEKDKADGRTDQRFNKDRINSLNRSRESDSP